MKQVDYYEVLEVRRSDDHETIKISYRRLARRYHPDLNSDNPAAVERFKEIAQAWSVLGDSDERRHYDVWGQSRGPSHPSYPPDLHGDPIEVLKRVFEQARAEVGKRIRRRRGKDLNIAIKLTFREALLGTKRVFEMPRLDPTGKVVRRRLEFPVPRGVTPGKVLRWQGQGAPGVHGGQDGDLIVRIHIEKHPVFRFSREKLCIDLYLEQDEAHRGCTVQVPTPWGVRSLDVPQNTHDRTFIEMPRLGGLNANNLKDPLFVQVHLPRNDANEVERKAFREAQANLKAYVAELGAGRRS